MQDTNYRQNLRRRRWTCFPLHMGMLPTWDLPVLPLPRRQMHPTPALKVGRGQWLWNHSIWYRRQVLGDTLPRGVRQISCIRICKRSLKLINRDMAQAIRAGHHVVTHDDVIKWKHFPRYWPFVRGIHRSRWIPRTKASDAEFWCVLSSTPE